MKFTLNWLRDHIETDLSAETIGAKLTMAGLELDALTRLDQGLDKVVVGFLAEVKPHPDADRLTVCQVRIGSDLLTIVCGAKNHAAGDKVAVACIGAHLPNGMKITETQIRGVTSQGMLCSRQELGLSPAEDGILILPADTQEGTPIAKVLGLDEVVLELGITPNRGDCLGVRGIARELGALTGHPLRPLPEGAIHLHETGATAKVQIEDPTGCPCYAGRIINNIRIAPSPAWLRNRLEASGMRSINNVVDITNFILLDRNQPLHAFDLACVQMPLVVRSARPGETLVTLDGMNRVLSEQMTVIADQQHVLALAGIMGGETSGVTEATTDIFLEAACFDPISTARTGRRLAILSESRHRFERGVDADAIPGVMEQATQMILELAGGQAGPITWVQARPPHASTPILYRPQRVNQLGGIALSATTMNTLLQRLGCQVTPMDENNHAFQVIPPSWRHDLRIEEDLLEEIIRLNGYDQVPVALPRVPADPPIPNPMQRLMERVRTILVGFGYLEAINYAFVSPAIQRRFNQELTPLPLLNPLSEDQAVLRTDLIAGLIETAQRNLNRGNARLRIFELGRVFLTHAQGDVTEVERLAGILTGPAEEQNVFNPLRQTDFFDLSSDVSSFLNELSGNGMTLERGGPAFLHPGRKAIIMHGNGQPIGWMGQLHPTEQEALDLRKELFVFELSLPPLLTTGKKDMGTEEAVSRFPSIQNDFTFLMPERTPARDVVNQVLQMAPDLIRRATITAIYTGPGVPPGEKSLTLSILLQADDRTLTDIESKDIAERIITSMRTLCGATLR
ncbi:MAG: phenylalanine--tRNA ligase subunit beta [Magnetococcus sp. YQC-5]